MNNDSAIRPNYFEDFSSMPAFKEVAEIEEQLSEEEKSLGRLAKNSDWQVLKAYIEAVMTDLDELVRRKMETGASLESIGQSTITKELTKDVLKRIIARVEDRRDK